jgi:hypothetical protein
VLAALVATPLAATPAQAAEEAGPPQPEAAVMTRTCEQNGALVVMNNFGGGSVTFNILVDNEASGSVTVGPGSQASHLVPIAEDQTVAIQVTADGMAPVAASRTRDCEGAADPGAGAGAAGEPGSADSPPPGAATDPIDTVPAGTPPPEEVPPTAVAGAADAPAATESTGSGDAAVAPATDPVAPSGTLPFTGVDGLGWLALAGLLLVGTGGALTRGRRPAARAAGGASTPPRRFPRA